MQIDMDTMNRNTIIAKCQDMEYREKISIT